ncbi:NAD(P)/FAD-dependent oxidoreductase [Massilia sp. YIM B02763]|uniref:NAD(P)/FAD-dependent oxidoreductase n=1 Tax=Massilia sp. YIM B02763 TaxID=3050130 RepID=UPI0025B684F2|nr:NAD(P)/FAD-dependent oxidoreductase [Massilia sp. YIM B02763]MDN4052597.1 NAD(P)/FAD-dependent oxidoreductase [Massilia sp. YIM B02763]
MFDVIVAGGSYAGMAAALQLVRARRKVLVVDAGRRRNRFAKASHGLLGQDGRSPDAIHADAKAQLSNYPDLSWREGRVAAAEREGDGFAVRLDDGAVVQAWRLILATGVSDRLPDVPGLAERWGDTVASCPYCHGYEFGRGRLGVLAAGELSLHHALLVPEWASSTVLFTNGMLDLTGQQREQLAARNVTVEAAAVTEVFGDKASVRLRDGRTVALDGLFVATRIEQDPLVAKLGCATSEGPMGPVIQTDEVKMTTVPGVFACGDAARMMASLSLAIGDGALAGIGAHRSLVFDGIA